MVRLQFSTILWMNPYCLRFDMVLYQAYPQYVPLTLPTILWVYLHYFTFIWCKLPSLIYYIVFFTFTFKVRYFMIQCTLFVIFSFYIVRYYSYMIERILSVLNLLCYISLSEYLDFSILYTIYSLFYEFRIWFLSLQIIPLDFRFFFKLFI